MEIKLLILNIGELGISEHWMIWNENSWINYMLSDLTPIPMNKFTKLHILRGLSSFVNCTIIVSILSTGIKLFKDKINITPINIYTFQNICPEDAYKEIEKLYSIVQVHLL